MSHHRTISTSSEDKSTAPPSYLGHSSLLRRPSFPYVSPYAPIPQPAAQQPKALPADRPHKSPSSDSSSKPSSSTSSGRKSLTVSGPASARSGSSQQNPLYSYPAASQYIVGNTDTMSLSQTEKSSLVQSLRTHKVNTLLELRRIEKRLSGVKSADVTESMTAAWAHYVNSNNLLSELRGLTKSYPFSSECLDEAKWMVIGDPQSTKSWNYCWLVLQKAKNQNLIPKHARQLAVKPAMWGGRTPTAAGVEQLTAACTAEWTRALNQLLRHWDSPPTLSGR